MSYLNKKRRETNQGDHDKAVKDIAVARFSYEENDTYTNPGGEKNAYVGPESNPQYPDIVVLEKGAGRRTAVNIAEIETADSINEEESKQWDDYFQTGIPFYLYVPSGYSGTAKILLKNNRIVVAGLRTYNYDQFGRISITNIAIE